MAADAMFGWDLTLRSVQTEIKRKPDVLIAFVHWIMVKRGFRTVGIGDERTLTGDEEKSETLPTGWNDKDNYTLRYVLENKLYILHGLTSDGNLIINLMRSEDLAVSNIALNIEDSIKETSGSVDKMMPNHKDILFNVKRDLVDSIAERAMVSVETQTDIARSDSTHRRPPDDPLRVPSRPVAGPNTPDLWERPPPAHVGRSDLDPFAPAGGGMIFNPFAPRRDIENPGLGIPGGLPRGAVPPGARFDPFGPPGGPGGPPLPGRRPGAPDADHLPPPGFNDNMFM